MKCALGGLALLGMLLPLSPAAVGQELDLSPVRALAAAGSPQAALESLEKMLAARPDDLSALFLKGVLLAEAGRSEEAERIFRSLIRARPDLPEPYNNLAVIQAGSGRYEEAAETLRMSLETHSSYGTAYRNLTRIYGRLAGEAYNRALGEESRPAVEQLELLLLADLAALEGATVSAPAAGTGSAASRRVPGGEAEAALALQGPVTGSQPAKAPSPDFAAFVRDWAAAWSEQRVEDYLACYASRFMPPRGLDRDEWEAQRRRRLTRPSYINVSVAFLGSRQPREGRASVRFIQSYESDTFRDTVTKTLELVTEGGAWKILAERVEP